MYKFKVVVLAAVCVLASACAPIPQATKNVFVYPGLNKASTDKVEVPAPPSREAFKGEAKDSENTILKKQVGLLLDYSKDLHATIDSCNRRLYNIHLWDINMREKVKRLNEEKK